MGDGCRVMAKVMLAGEMADLNGPINTAVKAWLVGQGFDLNDVRGYTLTYDANDVMTIDIRMYMTDEVPAPKLRKYCAACVERCETGHDPCLTESGDCAAYS